MSKIHIKVDGQTIGVVGSLRINKNTESTDGSVGGISVGGSASRIRFNKIHLFKEFYSKIHLDFPMELEFESDHSIRKAHRAWITNYSYHDSPDNVAIIMDYMDFTCEQLTLLAKEQELINKDNLPSPSQDEMINKFTAALSDYYRNNK
jgi:hypothetical protein